jgi:ABC-type multidrug transport system fused ATPase/permease subunit
MRRVRKKLLIKQIIIFVLNPIILFINLSKKIIFFLIGKDNNRPILAKKINFSYGNKNILKNINLNISKGKIVAILGNSGSGKSTFLNLISGSLSSKFSW